jgi:hypothetical protein
MRPGANCIWGQGTGSMTRGGWLFALLLLAGGAAAQSQTIREATTLAPDFSKVDSLDKARALEAEGMLVPILLFPAEFGGQDLPENVVYVPKEAAAAKDLITGTLLGFAQDGLIDQLSVEPTYKGTSFIPSRILMKASHSAKEGKFNPTVEIW